MGKVGRPPSKSGTSAAKKRKSAREWYRKQSPAKKKELYNNRDKEAQREADARRLSKDRKKRNEFHKRHRVVETAVQKGEMKKARKCSRCGSTQNVQFHHPKKGLKNAKKGVWLCAKCNNPANV